MEDFLKFDYFWPDALPDATKWSTSVILTHGQCTLDLKLQALHLDLPQYKCRETTAKREIFYS